MKTCDLKPGDKVTYTQEYPRKPPEKGIVKSVHPLAEAVWVVFNCGGDWENYEKYTSALVRCMDLKEGWDESGEK